MVPGSEAAGEIESCTSPEWKSKAPVLSLLFSFAHSQYRHSVVCIWLRGRDRSLFEGF